MPRAVEPLGGPPYNRPLHRPGIPSITMFLAGWHVMVRALGAAGWRLLGGSQRPRRASEPLAVTIPSGGGRTTAAHAAAARMKSRASRGQT